MMQDQQINNIPSLYKIMWWNTELLNFLKKPETET